MYFKIENKESELYKNVMAYIEKRRQQQKDNYDAVNKYFGFDFTNLLMYGRGMNSLNSIFGVVSENIIEGMKPDKCFENAQVPNLRTKKGKEHRRFFNSLPNWSFHKEHDLFPLKERGSVGRFTLPYLDEINDVIFVRIDDKFKPEETIDFIEITTSEFNRLTEK